jgi:hypothetical protein
MRNNNRKKIASRGLQTFEEKQRESGARARAGTRRAKFSCSSTTMMEN